MACILIVDDDPTIQLLFSQFFKAKNHKVLQAEDGRKGMASLKSQHPDLVITDIMMPEMDGFEVLTEIREDKIDIPVIVISGGIRDLSANFLLDAKLLGACHVFQKPVPLHALSTVVDEVLNATGFSDRTQIPDRQTTLEK